MKDLYIIFKNLTRNKLRFMLNCFAIFIAFFLFGVLGSLKGAFEAGVELSADDRMIVVNKINFTQPLPIAYINKIRALTDVKHATYANWFGGYYQDQRKQVVTIAVDPQSYLQVYPELMLDENARNAWFNNQQGMIVGESLAKVHGWKIGDKIPVSSNIFSKADGSHTWEMIISGIFSAKDAQTDTNYMLFHYKYFIETQTFGEDWIGWIILSTQDPGLNESVAKEIDTLFANSSSETETSSEKQFNKAFLEQIGSIGLIITSVVFAAFFTILLIVGNTMALAVRERTKEIAVLKILGFNAPHVFRLILVESLLLAFVGGLIGLAAAGVIVTGASQVPQLNSMLPNLVLTSPIVIQAMGFMLALGLLTGLLPAYRAMQLNTIDALNRD